MFSKYLKKLYYHKIIIFILTILYCFFSCIIFLKMDSDIRIEKNNLLFFCWFSMLLLLLLIVACFDGQSQPYLYVYHIAFFITPWLYFIGFIASLVILRVTANKILSIANTGSFVAGALFCYIFFNMKLKNVSEGSLFSKIKAKLIDLPKQDLDVLNKNKKLYKWDITILLAVVIVAGKYIAKYNTFFICFVCVVYFFCILSCLKIFKIRYKTKSKRILSIILCSIIYFSFAIFAVLLNFNVMPPFSESLEPIDFSMLVAFGLVPFAKQTSYAYFAQEHFKIREEIDMYNRFNNNEIN